MDNIIVSHKGVDIIKTFGKVLSTLAYVVLLTAVLFLAVMALISTNRENTFSIGKYSVYNVLTESMLPTFGMGSIIVVKDVPQSQIETGDIITFYPVEDNSTVLTHRIIDIVCDDGETRYQTQGDNNNIPDRNLIRYNKIIGKVVFFANGWGNYLLMIRSPIGITLMVGVTILLMILAYLSDTAKKKKKAAMAKKRKRRQPVSKTPGNSNGKKSPVKKRSVAKPGVKKKAPAVKSKKTKKKTGVKYKKSA